MTKNPRVRTLMDSQYVKTSETLPKSEILRLFLNILTPNDKYSLSVKGKV